MPDRELLEGYPLYRRKEVELPRSRDDWPTPAIKAPCGFCKSDQTYNMANDYRQYDVSEPGRLTASSQGIQPSTILRLVYVCASCKRSSRYYMVHIGLILPRPNASGLIPPAATLKANLTKVGQVPAVDIRPDPELAAKLGPDVEVFKKGLVCESQGYGIGAFAYYRRIVEGLIDVLLADVSAVVPAEDLARYEAALAKTKESRVAADKIEIVKELLPSSLRPGGSNPLSVLHSDLSEGIHSLSDEECLTRAVSIREVLVYMVHETNQARTAGAKFGEHLKRILDRRAESQS